MMMNSPAVELILQALIAAYGGPLTAVHLARLATRLDDVLGRAVFGDPPDGVDTWQVRPTTRFQIKASLYDAGLLDSPLGPRVTSPQQPTPR